MEPSKYFTSEYQGIALLSKGGGKSSKCFKNIWLGRQCMLTRKLGVNTLYTWDPEPQANTQII